MCSKPSGFTNEQGLHIHYGKSLHCAAHVAACQTYLQYNTAAHPTPFLSQPWDIDDEDMSIACVANMSVATPINSVLKKMGIDRIEADQKANKFGIKYAAEQYTVTKLLKFLNDAVSRYPIAWASEVKCNKYSFCPQCLERSSQVKYLEKWLDLKPCRP
jgi:hypothetical protein